MKNQMFIQPALQNISELPIIPQENHHNRHQNKGNHAVKTSFVIDEVKLESVWYLCTNMDIRSCWEL